jgi:hypothetical protein
MSVNPTFQFGIGEVFLIPTGGNTANNPTPQQAFTIQDVTFDITRKNVKLMGQNQLPDDVAPSDMEGKGELTVGALSIDMFNQVMFGEASTTPGIQNIQPNEAHTIPPNPGPYTVSVTHASAFTKDAGVIYASTTNAGAARQQFERVTGAPAAGEYAVSAGVYTFNAADANTPVAISYIWSENVGETLLVTSHLQGFGPVVEMWLRQPYKGKNGIHIFAARLSGLNAPLKRDNYQMGKIGFEFFPTQDIPPKFVEFFQVNTV